MRHSFGRLAVVVVAVMAALILAVPSAASARTTKTRHSRPGPVSHCGSHRVEFARGNVRLDGHALESDSAEDKIVVAPTWRRDCGAVAWIARKGGERRLVVVPSVDEDVQSIRWDLPMSDEDERIFWVARKRITVGVATLKPHAMASWSLTPNF
jgi:hypothetical protein